MKFAMLTAGACGAALVISLAAQERGFGPGGPPPGPVVSALDADHDGTISAAELGSASGALRSLDANHDGQLTFEELRPPFGGRRGDGPGPGGRPGEGPGGPPAASADELADTLMAFDRNADGRLERSEVPERFQGLFTRADTNKDDALTREELKQSAAATVQEGPGRRGPDGGRGFGRRGRGGLFDPLLRALDGDRDGTLSAQEIADATGALNALDENHDGQLSAEEFRPMPPRGPEDRR